MPVNTSGEKFPVSSPLNNLKGQFFVDDHLLSARSMLVALRQALRRGLLPGRFLARAPPDVGGEATAAEGEGALVGDDEDVAVG